MDLFEQALVEPINILPQYGEVNYHGEIMPLAESGFNLNALLIEVEWRCDQAVIFSKHIETKRKVAWNADEPFSYTYSNITKCGIA